MKNLTPTICQRMWLVVTELLTNSSVGIIVYAKFLDWFLSLSNMPLRFIHVLCGLRLHFLSLNNNPLYGIWIRGSLWYNYLFDKGPVFLWRLLTGHKMKTWFNTPQWKWLSSQTRGLFPLMLTFEIKFSWKPGNIFNFLLYIYNLVPSPPFVFSLLSLHSPLSSKQTLEM